MDHIQHYDPEAITHVAVACRGSIYKLQVYGSDGVTLRLPDYLEAALTAIQLDAPSISMGTLDILASNETPGRLPQTVLSILGALASYFLLPAPGAEGAAVEAKGAVVKGAHAVVVDDGDDSDKPLLDA